VRVEGLNVPARRSVFRFKDTELPVTDIGRQLGVANVLEGNVRKDGDRLKITAQLIGVEDGFNLWSNTYEVQVEDVFAVQEEIANAIVSSLEVRLVGTGGGKLVGEHTSNLEAFNLYLRGQFHLNKRVESHLLKAAEFYEEAIRLDPDYALAHAGLGWSYFHLSSWYRAPREVMPQAKAAAHAALELDDSLATAHALLGYINLNYDWNWDAAKQQVRRALELNPNSAEAHLLHALVLVSQGEADEGVREALRAEDLDPMAVGLKWDIWIALYFAREYEAAIQVCDRALQLDPEFAMSLGARGVTLMQMGEYERATSDLERAVAMDDDNITNLEFLLYTYAMSGDEDRARAGLEEMVRRARERYTCPYEVATVFVGLEEYDVALQWFEEGYEKRADCWVWGKVDPRMDVMREDERYRDLLRRVGHTLE
jgi:serine/threonine-protein kinase